LELRQKLGSYFSNVPKDVQFPNVFGEWMYDVLRRDIPTFDLLKFRGWVQAVRDGKADLLTPPLCADVLHVEHEKQSKDVVVNGEIITAKPAEVSQPVPKGQKSKKAPGVAKEPCRHFIAGTCTYGDKCRFKH
jgi:hypothetical protein